MLSYASRASRGPQGRGPLVSSHASRSWLLRRALLVAAPASLLLAGCSTADRDSLKRGGLPEPASDNAKTVLTLWQGAWVVAFLVGAAVWALILGAAVIYRRKSTDTGLPPQVRYNLPVEVLYTTLPIVMVGVYFYFTAQDQQEITEVKGDAAHCITVVGKRWSWDFNYQLNCANTQDVVYESGSDAPRPTLVLPVNEKVEFTVLTRDVIHSFWVTPFLFKRDLIPGVTNRFELTPTRIGTFPGKCAELCGTYHSRMLFTVKVVSRADYDAELQRLRALGQVRYQGPDTGPQRTGADITSESGAR